MSNNITLSKERLFKIFETNYEYEYNWQKKYKTFEQFFDAKMEDIIAEQIEEDIYKLKQENENNPGWACVIKRPKNPK